MINHNSLLYLFFYVNYDVFTKNAFSQCYHRYGLCYGAWGVEDRARHSKSRCVLVPSRAYSLWNTNSPKKPPFFVTGLRRATIFGAPECSVSNA